ncbi:MAG: spore maturation protein [Bernardetiaceae bacterium]|nr:spore maturation protein [Bernardetiaceae bacterium]
MALNYIWIFFFIAAFLLALFKSIVLGEVGIFQTLVGSTFAQAKIAFEIALALTGVMTLWLGIMRIGEKAGSVDLLAWFVKPFFKRLFPSLPPDHPAFGAMLMNFSANMLGLDNAATPLGLKAMKELQSENQNKDTASDAQIMFLVLNTSGLTLIPISVMVYRLEQKAADPSDIFLPILFATFFATLAGIVIVALYQKINLLQPVILAYLGGFTILITALSFYLKTLSQEEVASLAAFWSNFILFSVIILFVAMGLYRKINVYEAFIEGAKGGFEVAITIIPYLVAMLVAIGVFRESGAMDWIIQALAWCIGFVGLPTDFVAALPTAFMKPLSGGAARGLMIDTMQVHGADSFVGRLACMFQGSTDTTFYVLAVYFGSVGIKRARYAVGCGLFADVVGIIAAIVLAYIFFAV